jgi:hypothetical protein
MDAYISPSNTVKSREKRKVVHFRVLFWREYTLLIQKEDTSAGVLDVHKCRMALKAYLLGIWLFVFEYKLELKTTSID